MSHASPVPPAAHELREAIWQLRAELDIGVYEVDGDICYTQDFRTEILSLWDVWRTTLPFWAPPEPPRFRTPGADPRLDDAYPALESLLRRLEDLFGSPCTPGAMIGFPLWAPAGKASIPASAAKTHLSAEDPKKHRPRLTVEQANKKSKAILKVDGTKFTRLSERDQAKRIGCSWDTWNKTPLYKKLKSRKPDKATKKAKDGGPRNVVSLSAKLLETAVADDPGVLERLIEEQAAEQASDPSPLAEDPPDACPRRVKNRKRL